LNGEILPVTGEERTVPSTSQPTELHPQIAATLTYKTLVECFTRPGRQLKRTAFWLEQVGEASIQVTVNGLIEEADQARRRLQGLGIGAGDAVLLVLPTSTDFMFFFWGTLLAGATSVPAYPPARWTQLESFSGALQRMMSITKAKLAIVPEILRDFLRDNPTAGLDQASIVTPEQVWAAGASDQEPVPPKPEDPALIQFSSGSTGEPRGICLTHANILANVRGFVDRMRIQPDDVVVSWLPLYHDMGLIGTMIGPLMADVELVSIPPQDFLRRPDFWLRVLGERKGTVTVAPQFAYSLCVRKVHPSQLEGVDLSSLRILLNGAEPIHAADIEAFERQFESIGMPKGTVTPCYGLGEATLAVAMRQPQTGIHSALRPPDVEDDVVPPLDSSEDAAIVTSVGPPLKGVEVRIVSHDGAVEPDGKIGEICVRGATVCAGYVTAKGIEPAIDAEGWLATGDLGFIADGELYVTGRKKDLIIVGGRNFYPQDVEEEAARIDGLRPGRIAAFGIPEPDRGTEVLVVVAETNIVGPADPAKALTELRKQVLSRFGVTPYDIVIVGRTQLPLTTSGKLRRFQTRTEYLRESFTEVIARLRHAHGESAS
jgi:acyl-CoA synthetase (AMP-forming)/AMP-acid ligase II